MLMFRCPDRIDIVLIRTLHSKILCLFVLTKNFLGQ